MKYVIVANNNPFKWGHMEQKRRRVIPLYAAIPLGTASMVNLAVYSGTNQYLYFGICAVVYWLPDVCKRQPEALLPNSCRGYHCQAV